MLTLYKILVNTAYIILWPILIIKALKDKKQWRQRRCLNPGEYLPEIMFSDGGLENDKVIWLHASSMGEVRVLARLAGVLERMRPGLKYFISAYTKTGHALAKALCKEAEAVFYFPIDAYLPLRRLFRHFRPDGIVMVETEIWPYFLDFCRKQGIPLVLASGRISRKSYRRYRLFRRSLTRLFATYGRFAMQSEVDAGRIAELGADPERILVTGNIKNDAPGAGDLTAKRAEVRKRLHIPENKYLFIAASTRPGEEEIICQALKGVTGFPDHLVVLMAPRHLERLKEARAIINDHGIGFTLFSELESSGPTPAFILMDRMGYLADLFYASDIAFVGGTLVNVGGHNLMEPVSAGVPVLFGPSIHNVREAAEWIQAENLGASIGNGDELKEIIDLFLAGKRQFKSIHEVSDRVGVWEKETAAQSTAGIIIEEFGL